jgi:hypothetical protein
MFDHKIISFHLLTDVESNREKLSIKSISQIKDIDGVEYNQIINVPYIDYPPSETCTYPDRIGMVGNPNNPGSVITPGGYGCFKAHTDQILSITPTDDEIYLFFEADAILLTKPNSFINIVHYAQHLMSKNNIDYFHFGIFLYSDKTIWEIKPTHIESNFLTGTHCYMLLKEGVLHLQDKIKNETWQNYDFWLSEQCDLKFGIFDVPICTTIPGGSLIDKSFIK